MPLVDLGALRSRALLLRVPSQVQVRTLRGDEGDGRGDGVWAEEVQGVSMGFTFQSEF